MIVLQDVIQDSVVELSDDAVLERDGAERQMHVLLEQAPELILGRPAGIKTVIAFDAPAA